mmetsp:Transcript_11716/g.14214  ORF Transcript_11716/g.14214 Transcript_11716/m.14214 type:complete len:327 (+) Transcript_11716:11-991(+)
MINHTYGSTADSQAVAKENTHEHELAGGDFARAACCIRDEEDRKKHAEYMKKLRAVDPVRVAVDLRKAARPEAALRKNPARDIDGKHCCSSGHDCSDHSHHLHEAQNVIVELKIDETINEAETDSDFDSDFDDEEIIRQMINTRLQPTESVKVYEVHCEADLLKVLQEYQCVIILFRDDGALSQSLLRKLGEMKQVHPHYHFVTIRLSLLKKRPHPIISRAFSGIPNGVTDSSLLQSPILVAFEKGNGPVNGLLRSDLERSSELNVWLETLQFKSKQRRIGDNDDSAEEDDLGRFICKKPGCTRKFAHDHIEYVTQKQMSTEFLSS